MIGLASGATMEVAAGVRSKKILTSWFGLFELRCNLNAKLLKPLVRGLHANLFEAKRLKVSKKNWSADF